MMSRGSSNHGYRNTGCKIANDRMCPVVGIGCALCRHFLPDVCNHGCLVSDVFCYSAWMGCSVDPQTPRSSSDRLKAVEPGDFVMEETNCLRQTFCLAGAHSKVSPNDRRRKLLFKDWSKWQKIRSKVTTTANLFRQVKENGYIQCTILYPISSSIGERKENAISFLFFQVLEISGPMVDTNPQLRTMQLLVSSFDLGSMNENVHECERVFPCLKEALDLTIRPLE